MPYRPYHTACDQLLGPDETSIEAIKKKADETEDWRMCPNCHEFIDGSGDITIRKSRDAVVSSEEASEDGPATAILIAGLLFGDESKGAFVDYLTNITRAHTVVRYSGGPQAAHRVVTPEGQQHVFSQFGSGTFLGVHTYLSQFMLVDPLRLITEAMHLRQQGVAEPLSMLAIDRRAVLVTPLHKLACQAREQARGDGRHGSCGMGIWEATAYARRCGDEAPIVGDLGKPATLHQKLHLLKERLVKDLAFAENIHNMTGAFQQLLRIDVDELHQRYRDMDFIAYENLGRARIVGDEYLPERMQSGTTIFEGSQGVLLDENYGFHPHTTGSTTTFASADRLLQEAGFAGKVQRIGITRSYTTRHGTGPLPTEMQVSPVDEPHNKDHEWAGGFRVGPLDLMLLRYAIRLLGGVDGIAVSHMDHWPRFGRVATAYEAQPGDEHHLCRYGKALRGSKPLDASRTAALGRMRPMYREVDHAGGLGPFLVEHLETKVVSMASGETRNHRCGWDL